MSNVVPLSDPERNIENPAQHADTAGIQSEQTRLLSILADVLEAKNSNGALDALAGSIQQSLNCQRVAIARADAGQLKLQAISQQAFVDASSHESRLMVDAMQEACDRESLIRWPVEASDFPQKLGVLIAHRTLASQHHHVAYCSVPLFHENQCIGALLLVHRDGILFTADEALFVESVSLMVAPILAVRLLADRGILAVARERFHSFLSGYLDAERPGRLALAVITALFLIGAAVIPVESHITASAELVPLERRLVSAPRAGFVETVAVVSGEQVKPGQLLASLDRTELELERSRSASEVATAEVEYRAVSASFERQESAVARARLAQARAQQMLIESQLEQSQLRAPIAGFVLNTDLEHSIGAPISRGDTLFEVAPANGYQVHLLVDESDIRKVEIGQAGELALRARPGDPLSLTVKSVHPIAEAGNGMSRFRVRASLSQPIDVQAMLLRPGESGRARLQTGHSNLLHILLSPLWQRIVTLKWRLIG